jgi:hypothetical protein
VFDTGQGVSHNILIAIQTGWTSYGKKCDSQDGAYSDVETLLTAGNFNEVDIHELHFFSVETYYLAICIA